jgi:hypothetical protein
MYKQAAAWMCAYEHLASLKALYTRPSHYRYVNAAICQDGRVSRSA